MWLDVMGAGPAYHGAEFRLNFHHTHNAIQLMNDEGARRWVKLMIETLEDSGQYMAQDPRIRPSLNTFLTYFFGKYADEFSFDSSVNFGPTNPAIKQKINFMSMTSDAIEALSETELRDALKGRGVDVDQMKSKSELINKALSL